MEAERLLAANTSAYAGYDLQTALAHMAEIGYRQVEIAVMTGLIEHVPRELLNARHAARIRRVLAAYALSSTAFSAHHFMCREDAIEVFLPRMEFAREIGASIVNTKAGPPAEMDNFLQNMETVLVHAERIDIRIGLETHGDIVSHGPSAVEAVRRFGSDRLLLNYDFGNVYANSGGAVDPASDFAAVSGAVGHLHFKDVKAEGEWFRMCAVGEGLIDYGSILGRLAEQRQIPPCTVDLPLALAISRRGEIDKLEPLPLAEIDRILAASRLFILRSLRRVKQDP